MQIEEFFVPKPTSSNPYDPTQLSCLRWWDSDSPRFVLAIVHGLGEHARRYRHVAEYFVGKGGVVVGIDQQGHGQIGRAHV